jgi:hypothetical protein
MLEVVRQYAHERLEADADVAAATRAAHCDYYVALAEGAHGELRGLGQQRWFRRLDDEAANLRAALRWALDEGVPGHAVRLVAPIDVWWERTAPAEGRRWLEQGLLAGGEALPAPVRARGLLALGFLVASTGDTAGGLEHVEQARVLAAEATERHIVADCLMHRSFLETILQRPERAFRTADEARAVASQLKDPWLGAMSRYAQVTALTASSSVAAARPLAQESVEMLRELGDLRHVASLQSDLAYAAVVEHQPEVAGPLIDEVVEISRRTGDASMLAVALGNQALVALAEGDREAAGEILHETLDHCHRHGIYAPVPEALTALATIAASDDDAAYLVGAADALRTGDRSPMEEELHRTVLDDARVRAGPARWDRRRAAGSRLTLDEAIRHAATSRPSRIARSAHA